MRGELQKSEIANNVALLKQPYRRQVESFIQDGKLPESVSEQFVQALNDALQGLEKVVLEGGEFFIALTKLGMPCSVDELYERLDAFLQKKLEGKRRDKVRVEIDW